MLRHRLLILLLTLAGLLAAPARADEIVLVSGEVLQGAIIERREDHIVLDHSILGELTIYITDIATINGREPGTLPVTRNPTPPPEPPSPETPPDSPPEDSPPSEGVAAPEPPPVPEEPKPVWKTQLEAGLNATSGTTDTSSFRLSYRASVEQPNATFRFDSTYRFAESQGERTENRFTAGTFNEWRQEDSQWNAFAQSRFDSDEFQSWDQRLTLGGGFGYRLLELERTLEDGSIVDTFLLTTRLGGGLRREFGSLDTDLAPEGLLGLEFTWRISDHQRLSGGTTLFPDLIQIPEFRASSNLDWTLKIDEFDGVSLKVGLSHAYESMVDPGIDHNDLSIYATLVVDF